MSVKVTYLGPKGTYSHQVAATEFPTAELLECATIEDAIESVDLRLSDYSIIPFENSTFGSVKMVFEGNNENQTLDGMVRSKGTFKIIKESYLDIHHCLLSNEPTLSSVKTVYSHTQALNQCQTWLKTNIPDAKLIETDSTAKAGEIARNKDGAAAIGSTKLASIYGFKFVTENIETYKNNTTRFFVIGNADTEPTGSDITIIMFSVNSDLGEVLSIFLKHKLKLITIECRPSAVRLWYHTV